MAVPNKKLMPRLRAFPLPYFCMVLVHTLYKVVIKYLWAELVSLDTHLSS